MRFRVGDVVRVERDETLNPSRGTWPRYRGRVAWVTGLNRPDNEIGVRFDSPPPADGRYRIPPQAWFRPHELTLVERRAAVVDTPSVLT